MYVASSILSSEQGDDDPRRALPDQALVPAADGQRRSRSGLVLAMAAAHRRGLSHSTVKHHLANARSKVGAETTAQLVWILWPRLPEPAGMAPTDE
jgi:hypothetical protein